MRESSFAPLPMMASRKIALPATITFTATQTDEPSRLHTLD